MRAHPSSVAFAVFSVARPVALLVPCAALLAACSMGAAGDGADAPGGNVGFGGAQDIGAFRSILENGEIPGPGTLDAAGFFAEHYVDLPPADCGQSICLQSMLSVGGSWVDKGYQATLAVALNTPEDPAAVDPKPLDLVVVVDTSASMIEDDRIGYVKQGLDLLVDRIGAEDRMALVRYSSDVSVAADFTVVSETGAVDDAVLAAWREDMHAKVDALAADGATNLHGGLEAGFQLALVAREAHPERSQRVILLSDGQPTAGVTDDESIIAMAEGYIESGIGLTTIGVGQDFNLALMSGLAERGAGNFYFLEDPQAIQEVFTEELAYFVEPLALSVTIEVRAAAGYFIGDVTGTKLWRAEDNFGSMHLPAVFRASRTGDEPGEGGGRRGGGGTLFLQMLPGPGTLAGPIAEVRVRYRPVDGGEIIEQMIEVANPASPDVTPEDAYYSHVAMVKQYVMYNLFLGLRAASEQAEYNYTCALERLRDLDARAEAWSLTHGDANGDDDIAADRELMALFMTNLREHGAEDLPEGQTCDTYYGPQPVDDVYYNEMACSAGGNASAGAGMAMMLLWASALAWASRRVRRAPAA
ncbi:MAG TPA: VWA domain-containing protein [Haliangium sp.]|nr:VWA domain-containing protein [Haliangium sp.]